MRTFKFAAAASGLAATMIALTVPGTASAAASAEAVGGPEKITISVREDKPWTANVLIDGALQQVLPTRENPTAVITGVKPGSHRVQIYLFGENTYLPAEEVLNRQVEVSAANPLQDLINSGSAKK
ncbi:hypothetical protein [Nocardia sp. NPDC052566]|uniref:hypothetical protein n=1 Tax=Nocardia sp. NPDC052566 TaxID=3364330 RepID=UPI0037C94EC9